MVGVFLFDNRSCTVVVCLLFTVIESGIDDHEQWTLLLLAL